MNWPNPVDYCDELQNPHLCFSLDELRKAEVEKDEKDEKDQKQQEEENRLPKPYTGGFVVAFKLKTARGELAVRCFHYGSRHDADRYLAISRHLAKVRLPYFTKYDYHSRGIRVDDKWYPIIVMPWVQGESLKTYVERHLQEPHKLRSLAKAWLKMLGDLRRHGIAHGDLHHDNILVDNGRIRLIDYDGMYVPGLAGLTSHEKGEYHYEHPKRSAAHFGPYLDNFSGWVIYLSLLSLSYKPELWKLVKDKQLLFNKEDFLIPRKSEVWPTLAEIPEVARLAAMFRKTLKLTPDQVPPPPAEKSVSSWLFCKPDKAKQRPLKQPVQFKGPDWVLDYMQEEPDEDEEALDLIPSIQPKMAPDLTTALAVWLVICSFLGLATWAGLMKPLTATMTAGLFGVIQLLGVWFRRRYCGVGSNHNNMRSETEDSAPGI